MWLILMNVRHVLKLKLNLMSAGKLDDKWFTSHFANGVWKLLRRLSCCSKREKSIAVLQNGVTGF